MPRYLPVDSGRRPAYLCNPNHNTDLLELKPDVLVDAIDQPKNKCLLIDQSRKATLV